MPRVRKIHAAVAQGRDQRQRLHRRRLPGCDSGAQVFQQLQQFGTPRGPGRQPHRRHFRNFGRRCLSLNLGSARLIAVKALAGLAAQHAAGQALRGDDARPVAVFFVVLVVN